MTALVLGTVLGIGLWALALGLVPLRPRLGAVLRRPTTSPPARGEGGWATRLGRPVVPVLRAAGLPTAGLRRDLAVLSRPAEVHLAQQATAALIGALAAPAAVLVLGLAGVGVGPTVPVLGALVAGVIGFAVPDLRVRTEAARWRTDFRHALSAYLDLVGITLAGGAGVDSALSESAAIGDGWAFTQIRRALDGARLTRTPVGDSLRRLGEQVDIGELSELGASISLAGTEGARIRASLTAKADALRTRLLTDVEAGAQSATERMSLPVTLLFLGFLIFIGYPALTTVLSGL